MNPQPPVISSGGRVGCFCGAGIGGSTGGVRDGVVPRYWVLGFVGIDSVVRPLDDILSFAPEGDSLDMMLNITKIPLALVKEGNIERIMWGIAVIGEL